MCAFCTLDTTFVFMLMGVFFGSYIGELSLQFRDADEITLVACVRRCYNLG